MVAGNYESISALEAIGYEEVNKNKIFVKFMCTELQTVSPDKPKVKA